MFGLRQADAELLFGSKQWLDDQLKNVLGSSFEERNTELERINKELDDELNTKLGKKQKSDKSDLRRYAGLLDKLITDINDEPMKDFFDITRQYFESHGMKECVISHIFNYDYIQIRDASWPRCIHFEWYPLRIKGLTSNNCILSLCLHVENSKYQDAFRNVKIGSFRHDSSRTSTLSYSCQITFNKQKSIIDLGRKDLQDFLNNAYSCIDEGMIEIIENAISSVKQ